MIFGRSPNLFLGLLTAGLGLATLVSGQLGYPIPAEIVAATGTFLGALVAVIAGNDNLAVQKGLAAQARLDAKG
jgi:hypothetical protein